MPCYDAEIHAKANVEPWWNNTSVFLGDEQQNSPQQPPSHGNLGKECMGLLTDFKKKMQQTKLHLRHLIKLEVHVNSLLLNITNTMNADTKLHQHDQKGKSLPQNCCPHPCVPSPSNKRRSRATHRYVDVGYKILTMGHTQVIRQDGLFQSGREDIQLRVSVRFSRLTMNSVMASPSKLPNPLEAVR